MLKIFNKHGLILSEVGFWHQATGKVCFKYKINNYTYWTVSKFISIIGAKKAFTGIIIESM